MSQSYQNFRHIVLYDQDSDYESYLKSEAGIETFRVDAKNLVQKYAHLATKKGRHHWFRPNLYLNEGLDRVQEGWVLILDDDDHPLSVDSLERIARNLNDEEALIVWQIDFCGGNKLPPDEVFEQKEIKLYSIATCCFCFHSKWKDKVRWDGYRSGDFRFALALSQLLPRSVWIPEVLMRFPEPGRGLRKDAT